MLAAEHYTDVFADAALPKPELLEIHRSKISLHHAKADYDYPTIHLPHSIYDATVRSDDDTIDAEFEVKSYIRVA